MKGFLLENLLENSLGDIIFLKNDQLVDGLKGKL